MDNRSKTKKGLWAILLPVKLEIFLSLVLAGIGAVSVLCSLLLLSFTISFIIEEKAIVFYGYELDFINSVLLIGFFTLLAFLLRFYAFMVSHFAAFKLEEILRTDISLHLAKVPLGFIATNGSGALKKVMLSDVKNLHAFVADSIPMIAKSIIAPITSLCILIVIDYRLAIASIFVLLIGMIVMHFATKDPDGLMQKYEESQTNIHKAAIEFVQAMPVVRTFDNGLHSSKRYNKSLLEYKENLLAWVKNRGFPNKLGLIVLSPLPTLLVVFLTGLLLLDTNSIEGSHLIVALFISTGMADALMPLMWLNNFLKKSQSAAIRIHELLEIEQLKETTNPKIPNKYDLEFINVSFSYEGTNSYAIKDINFSVKQNSVTALVGGSGAGKSTVAKLIPRFWDIDSGEIKIGGVNIKDIDSNELMKIVSFVFQDTFLFNDTIFNNIKMAKEEASKDEVIQAAKVAQIHEFIESLPNGYETKAGDRGANLSGGQKQRITIARAVLRNSPIVILDEATAFADPQSEEEIIKALSYLMKDKTVIVIAHRLSTIKDADQIVVFDKGKVVEKAKHKELVENKGEYYELWESYQQAQTWDLKKGKNNG